MTVPFTFARSLSCALASAVIVASGPARADFGASFSLGAGVTFGERSGPTSANTELIGFYNLGPLLVDLGFLYDFNTTRGLTLRPGFRVDAGYLYFRTAIPLQVVNGRDYGVYLALGKTFQWENVGALIEVGKNFLAERGVAQSPLEFRLGLNFFF